MNDGREDAVATVRNIVRALARLALPAEVQIELLEKAHLPSDELALDFEWSISTLWQAREIGLIDQRIEEELMGIDRRLGSIGGPEHAELWEDAALRAHPVWENVRTRAREVLGKIHSATGISPPSEDVFRAGEFDLH
ncbi:hypothetical protein Sru01_18440 [Sphaerisporangium rufum]|uniref:Uncharacterized protein n=1 Tax=Sphaerisporangium rufum TaxID=1381558 RepID=A0A919QZI5_9ACTN|nr:hypothetical protein [Sphaerisporangium rufum]GII76862.1 hypothetical protein Sru01_18440 [Sphaerisporangium rufum]